LSFWYYIYLFIILATTTLAFIYRKHLFSYLYIVNEMIFSSGICFDAC